MKNNGLVIDFGRIQAVIVWKRTGSDAHNIYEPLRYFWCLPVSLDVGFENKLFDGLQFAM